MKVILVSGKACAGKDETAKILSNKLKLEGYRVLIAHYADLVKYVSREFWGWDGVKDEVGRTLLQQVGTNIVREKYPNYWVDFVMEFVSFSKAKWDCVIIPDCRFPNEVDCWAEDGWDSISVKVIRNDFTNNLTEEQKKHPSETAMDNYEFDYYINNKEGIENLVAEIEKFYEWIIYERES